MRKTIRYTAAAIVVSLMVMVPDRRMMRENLSPESAFALAIADPIPSWVEDFQGSGAYLVGTTAICKSPPLDYAPLL